MVNPDYQEISSLFNRGKSNFIKGDYLSATVELENLISKLDNKEDIEYLHLHINALLILGRTALYEGKTEKSKNCFSEIRKITDQTELERWGIKINLLGEAWLDQYFGKLDTSITKLRSIIGYLRELKEEKPEIMGKALNSIGTSYFQKGLVSQANNYFQKAKEIIETIDDEYELSSVIKNQGNIEYMQGNYSKAIDFYTQSLLISRDIENIRLISASINNMAICYEKLGKNKEAFDYYTEALELSKRLEDPVGIAVALGNLGGSYADMGNFTQALSLLNEALEIQQEIGNPVTISYTYSMIGLIQLWMAEIEESISTLKKGLEILQKIDNKPDQAEILQVLIDALINANKFDEAKKTLDYFSKLKEEAKNPVVNLFYYYTRGILLLAHKKLDEAGEAFSLAKNFASLIEDYRLMASTNLRCVEIHLLKYQQTKDRNLIDNAEIILDSIIESSKENNLRVMLIEALMIKGKIKTLLNDFQSANAIFEFCINQSDSFGFSKASSEIELVEIPEKEIGKRQTFEELKETRELISSLYEEKEVIMNVVNKILRMKIPWPSKQKMIVSCVQDLEIINESKLEWLNNGLISNREFASLELLVNP
ncbi:MAG: tetratricopeptide repeat protein [Candidatus Heimdallarchaeota archaeon]|nr:tetratricopeptide repeat protein [Candidatus Heimdallarchaeota archaeon]MCK5049183.1 tetratricopeptide repeat protein [Candidatus Heimdallarchaeota archaeon]